jgi:hypothetical protein
MLETVARIGTAACEAAVFTLAVPLLVLAVFVFVSSLAGIVARLLLLLSVDFVEMVETRTGLTVFTNPAVNLNTYTKLIDEDGEQTRQYY